MAGRSVVGRGLARTHRKIYSPADSAAAFIAVDDLLEALNHTPEATTIRVLHALMIDRGRLPATTSVEVKLPSLSSSVSPSVVRQPAHEISFLCSPKEATALNTKWSPHFAPPQSACRRSRDTKSRLTRFRKHVHEGNNETWTTGPG